MNDPKDSDTFYLPPTDTVLAWEQRAPLRTTTNWREMMHEEHATAFTVAKIQNVELLGKIRASLDDVIRNGGTFEQWKKNLLPELKRAGWWGVVNNPELTGTTEDVIVNERRIRNIYRTNVMMSQAAGRWRRIWADREHLPYLRYVSDHYRKHPRLNHKSWHGLIYRVEDPIWQWLFPPNGWGCNCTVQQLSQEIIDSNGWKVSAPIKLNVVSGRDNGEPGVTEGFAYNPGKAHMEVLANKAVAVLSDLAERNAIAIVSDALDDLVASPGFSFWLRGSVDLPVALLDEAVGFPRLVVGSPKAVTELIDDAAWQSLRLLLREPHFIAVQDNKAVIARTFGDRHLSATLTKYPTFTEFGAVNSIRDRDLFKRSRGFRIVRDNELDQSVDIPTVVTDQVFYMRAGDESDASVLGYRRGLKPDELRHIRIHHPEITDDELRLIPEIVRKGEASVRLWRDKEGRVTQTTQEFWLNISGIDYTYIERVGHKKRQLLLKTFHRGRSRHKENTWSPP